MNKIEKIKEILLKEQENSLVNKLLNIYLLLSKDLSVNNSFKHKY